MAKAKEESNAVIYSVTESDETVSLSVDEDGHYVLDTKVTGPVAYDEPALTEYLLGVRRREIGQTLLVRQVAPILLDKLGQ